MRYLSIILFTILCSCNDGGSDPEFVKSKRTDPTPEQQLHLDTQLVATTGWVVDNTKNSIKPIKFRPQRWKFVATIKIDTSALKNSLWGLHDTFPAKDTGIIDWKKTHLKILDATYCDVIISSQTKGIVAYLKRDSAWIIKDSAETFRMMLYGLEQQAKSYQWPKK